MPQKSAYARATPTQLTSIPSGPIKRSAGPFTGAPAMIGLTPTTRSRRRASTSRTPGTARIGPIEITGFDGQMRMVSAASSAASTPGAGCAVAIPSNSTATTGGLARSRTNHSCIARVSSEPSSRRTVTRVATRSSLIGRSRGTTPHAAAISADTSETVAPSASRSVR